LATIRIGIGVVVFFSARVAVLVVNFLTVESGVEGTQKQGLLNPGGKSHTPKLNVTNTVVNKRRQWGFKRR